jgi:hypothetical protein
VLILFEVADRSTKMNVLLFERSKKCRVKPAAVDGHGWGAQLLEPCRAEQSARNISPRPALELASQAQDFGPQADVAKRAHGAGLNQDPRAGFAQGRGALENFVLYPCLLQSNAKRQATDAGPAINTVSSKDIGGC